MAGAHSAGHVAALIAQLPDDARLARVEDEDYLWTIDRTLMAAAVNALNLLIYSQGNKKRRGPRPEAIGPTWMRPRRSIPARVLAIEELMEELSKARNDGD